MRLVNLFSALLLTILLPVLSFASEKYPDTFLWKISKNGAPESYLLGTMHIGRKGAGLSPQIEKALAASSTVITETNMGPDAADELMVLAVRMLDLKNPLSAKLGKELFGKLASAVNTTVPDPSTLENFHPWAVLAMIMYSMPEGYSEEYGVDIMLTNRAIELGKQRRYAETNIDAVENFIRLPENRVIQLIEFYADNIGILKNATKEMARFYEKNKVNEILGMAADDEFIPDKDSEFWLKWMQDELIDKRNDKWMPLIREQLAKESTLIAVGAMHLFTENGLIERIRDLGYKVEPILP